MTYQTFEIGLKTHNQNSKTKMDETWNLKLKKVEILNVSLRKTSEYHNLVIIENKNGINL